MRANAALKMIARILQAAETKGVARATRHTLCGIVTEQKSSQATKDALNAASDRPWATKDLTQRTLVLGNFERLGKSNKDEVAVGEVIACFPTLPYGEQVEPVVIISMPFKDDTEAVQRRGRKRLEIEKALKGEAELPGLRKGEDGYYIDQGALMDEFSGAFSAPTEEVVRGRLGLASMFLQLGYRVAILLPLTLSGQSNTLPLAVEGAKGLESQGAEVFSLSSVTSRLYTFFEWPRDLFTQLEGTAFVDREALPIFAELKSCLKLNLRTIASDLGDGGRVVTVGESFVYGQRTDSYLRYLLSGGGRNLADYEDTIRAMCAEEAQLVPFCSRLGFGSVLGIPPFWSDLLTDGQLERAGIGQRVFYQHTHIDMVLFAADASREMGVHARFYRQNPSLVDRLAEQSGYTLRQMPDRASFVPNALSIERGGYDLVIDQDSEPEKALLNPSLRVLTSPIPFADSQQKGGGIRCAANILWVPGAK